jgi:hypothetical protein
MTSLHQIWYDEKQLPKLLPYSIPYKNEGLTIYFENVPIVKLVRETTADKIGVTSWKLADKMRKHDRENLRLGKDGDYQVLGLTRNSARHQMLGMLYAWHPKSKEAMTLLWQKLGYKMPGEAKNPIYQNALIAKTQIYKDYVENFLAPAIELTETDEEMRNLMLQPSGYGKLSRSADLKSVKAKLGMTDYPLAPFILERCPSLWFTMKKINVSYL